MANPRLSLRFTTHAREQMAERDVVALDVSRVLSKGRVTWVETKKDVIWHVEGRDVDERMLRIVVVVHETYIVIKIVTVIVL
jgi:hypothetical protein